MFSRLATLLPLAALAAVAVAAPSELDARGNYCSTGGLYCCNQKLEGPTSLGPTGLNVIQALLSLGLTCTPVSVIGVSGVSCTQQQVCCNDVSNNGLVNVDCNNVNVSG